MKDRKYRERGSEESSCSPQGDFRLRMNSMEKRNEETQR